MPSTFDIKNRILVFHITNILSEIWGHWAGGPPGNFEDVKWLDERLGKLLNDELDFSKLQI